MPVLAVRWRLANTFDRLPEDEESSRRYRVTAESQAAVAAALSRMPAPSALIDAGPEVAAIWRLSEPLPAEDAACAYMELATYAGAEHALVPRTSTFTLPIGGRIRNWDHIRTGTPRSSSRRQTAGIPSGIYSHRQRRFDELD